MGEGVCSVLASSTNCKAGKKDCAIWLAGEETEKLKCERSVCSSKEKDSKDLVDCVLNQCADGKTDITTPDAGTLKTCRATLCDWDGLLNSDTKMLDTEKAHCTDGVLTCASTTVQKERFQCRQNSCDGKTSTDRVNCLVQQCAEEATAELKSACTAQVCSVLADSDEKTKCSNLEMSCDSGDDDEKYKCHGQHCLIQNDDDKERAHCVMDQCLAEGQPKLKDCSEKACAKAFTDSLTGKKFCDGRQRDCTKIPRKPKNASNMSATCWTRRNKKTAARQYVQRTPYSPLELVTLAGWLTGTKQNATMAREGDKTRPWPDNFARGVSGGCLMRQIV